MSLDPPERLVTISHEAGCLTCADEAVVARVRSVDGLEAIVAVGEEVERVAIDLVPDARAGEQLLCHAGIALERLPDVPGTRTWPRETGPGAWHEDAAARNASACLTPPEAAT